MERSKRTTAERLKTLREIIKTEPTSTQQELVEKLKQAGFKVTQSTVSRDLKKIGAMKVFLPDGTYEYTLPEATSLTIDERIVTIVKKVFWTCSTAPPYWL